MKTMYKDPDYYYDEDSFDEENPDEETYYSSKDIAVAEGDGCGSPIYVHEGILMFDDGGIYCAECAARNEDVHDIVMEEFIYPQYYTELDAYSEPNEEWLHRREIRNLKDALYKEYVREFKNKHCNSEESMTRDYGCPVLLADDELISNVVRKWSEN